MGRDESMTPLRFRPSDIGHLALPPAKVGNIGGTSHLRGRLIPRWGVFWVAMIVSSWISAKGLG